MDTLFGLIISHCPQDTGKGSKTIRSQPKEQLEISKINLKLRRGCQEIPLKNTDRSSFLGWFIGLRWLRLTCLRGRWFWWYNDLARRWAVGPQVGDRIHERHSELEMEISNGLLEDR